MEEKEKNIVSCFDDTNIEEEFERIAVRARNKDYDPNIEKNFEEYLKRVKAEENEKENL